MSRLRFTLLFLVLAPLVHWFQRAADRDRFEQRDASERFYIPEPSATKALVMGHQTMVADLFWIRTVLIFSEFAFQCNPVYGTWLVGMIRTMTTLDPGWRTLYMYGGLMMGVCHDYDASDAIFEMGYKQFPNDYFFPSAIGMNAYSDRKDYDRAAHWMKIASGVENAPEWYRRTVAAMLNKKGQRSVAIEYLRQQIETSTDERIQKRDQMKLNRLLHEEYTEEIARIQEETEERLGRSLHSLSEMSIPMGDPFEEGWVLAPDGVVRSRFIEKETYESMQSKERRFLRKRWGKK